jgi:hypothetical protein
MLRQKFLLYFSSNVLPFVFSSTSVAQHKNSRLFYHLLGSLIKSTAVLMWNARCILYTDMNQVRVQNIIYFF